MKPGELVEVNVDLAMAKIGHFSKVSNRRIEDLRVAAKILKDRSVPQGMKLIVITGSSDIYKKAIQEGIMENLLDAGALQQTEPLFRFEKMLGF